ncbi:MAG: type I restriction endonuclease subunit R [Bacteroidales bacterium]|nr:type I restriction endonuclease subunit R [Bacteroidales bacterium]
MSKHSTGELDVQDQVIKKFFTDQLLYRCQPSNLVNTQNWILEADLREYLSETNINREPWKRALRSYGGNDSKMWADIKDQLTDKMYSYSNMAIFFKQMQSFSFAGETFTLYAPSGATIGGDTDFEQNIFSVVFELTFSINYEKQSFRFRPDKSLFLNGFFIGYSELKSNFKGQTARTNGRKKVITDYLEAAQAYLNVAQKNDKTEYIRRRMLFPFEKGISITTTDINDTYVIRNIGDMLGLIRDDIANGRNFDLYRQKAEKFFKPLPLRCPEADEQQRFSEAMHTMYDKKMIEREILYYNFLKYTWIEDPHNRHKLIRRGDNTGKLIAPRPRQKFGCEKIIDRIPEFIAHEDDPDYYLRKLEKELRDNHVSEADIIKRVDERRSYQNNKNIYSLLLQYAAGFGKSNIIGWTALMLKDLTDNKGQKVYDKIIIVPDRVELRGQLDEMLYNMNIEKSLFVEATDRKSFREAILNDFKPIVVVNIHKFGADGLFAPADLQSFASKRICFIIDEIHRSNSGTMHEDMISLFDVLQSSFDNNKAYCNTNHKKNLIIGFTATPTENALARFGEYKTFAEAGKQWVPFDCYTMQEAIKDGYILDPTQRIIPVSAKMFFYVDAPTDYDSIDGDSVEADEENTKRYALRKEKIYSEPERMKKIALFIVKELCEKVYGKIRGQGKAMLAVSSIPNAIAYKKLLDVEYPRFIAQNGKKYEKYKDAPIYIVYSDSQDHEIAASLNNGLSERKVIEEFKRLKNGIIIVVDKLQTGFDEPKLHSLFLDKEISGINAIQTISRVDRKCDYKIDCCIYDFSHLNFNVKSIKKAMDKYSGMAISDFNPFDMKQDMVNAYNTLKGHILFENWFDKYKTAVFNNNAAILVEIESAMRTYITTALANAETSRKNDPHFVDEATNTKHNVSVYFHALDVLQYILLIEDEYKEQMFINFWLMYSKLYTQITSKFIDPADDIEVYFDEKFGISTQDEEPERGGGGGNHTPNGKPKPTDIARLLELLNEKEENTDALITEFKEHVQKFFEFIRKQPESGRFIAKLNDPNNVFSVESIEREMNLFKKKFDLRERSSENKSHKLFMEVYKNDNYALLERFRLWLKPESKTYKMSGNYYNMAAEPPSPFGE